MSFSATQMIIRYLGSYINRSIKANSATVRASAPTAVLGTSGTDEKKRPTARKNRPRSLTIRYTTVFLIRVFSFIRTAKLIASPRTVQRDKAVNTAEKPSDVYLLKEDEITTNTAKTGLTQTRNSTSNGTRFKAPGTISSVFGRLPETHMRVMNAARSAGIETASKATTT